MSGRLEHLLRRIRDGHADSGDLAEARRLVACDARIPDEIREVALFDDDVEGDAAGLLSVLGADDLFGENLFDAILAEAGPLHGADDLPTSTGLPPGREEPVTALEALTGGFDLEADDPVELDQHPDWLPLAEALREGLRSEAAGVDLAVAVGRELGLAHIDVAGSVRAEAGRVDLAAQVAEALGHSVHDVSQAVRAEAGPGPELAHAVLAALGEPGLPLAEAVRAEAGRCEVGAAVLQALGESLVPLAESVQAEAGRVELAGAVLAELGQSVLPVSEAVRAESGRVELAERVLRTLSPEALAGVLDHELDDTTHRLAAGAIAEDHRGDELTAMAELGAELRSTLRQEAGRVELWAAVAGAIGIADPEHVEGWDDTLLAEAVRAEAGTVELAEAVLRDVRRTRPVQMPLAEMPVDPLPAPANRSTWGWAGLVAAALVLLALGLQGVLGPVLHTGQGIIEAVPELTFASADELVVEDLQYGEDVTVFQTEGDDGAVIIWVDEEAEP